MSENVENFVMQGHWIGEQSSEHINAELHVDSVNQVRVISLVDNEVLQTGHLTDTKVSSRFGDPVRKFYFSGGEIFETQDHTKVDLLLKLYGTSLWDGVVHQLKLHSYFICVNLLLIIGLSWWGMNYAIPGASKVVANQLTQSMLDSTSTETLQLLDKIYLEPTKLDEKVQARVMKHFAPALKENTALHIKVIFRGGGDSGANAFALPNGTIIFTDEMVNLAKTDNELAAVLMHEIGHVKYRHSLRSVIQNSSLGSIVSMLMGDTGAVSSLLSAVPMILITIPYSNEFEREAQQNAFAYLDAKKIRRNVLVGLMKRVTYAARCDFLLQREVAVEVDKEVITDEKEIHSSAAASSFASKFPTGKDLIAKDPAQNNSPTAKDKIANKTEEPVAVTVEEKPVIVSIEDQIAAKKIQCDKLMAAHDTEDETIKDYFSAHPGTKEQL